MKRENFRIAIQGILSNRLRSALTMLGILIGVGAVILLVAVGNGSSIAVQKNIQNLGTNTLIVFRGGGFGRGAGNRPGTQSRLINLTAAEGHPAVVMDMSFANQALSAEYVVQNHTKLKKQVYVVPKVIDDEIARLKLISMGVKIDKLTPEQKKYLNSWEEGTE